MKPSEATPSKQAAASTSSTQRWWIRRRGAILGRWDRHELERRWRCGQLLPTDEISSDGRHWRLLGRDGLPPEPAREGPPSPPAPGTEATEPVPEPAPVLPVAPPPVPPAQTLAPLHTLAVATALFTLFTLFWPRAAEEQALRWWWSPARRAGPLLPLASLGLAAASLAALGLAVASRHGGPRPHRRPLGWCAAYALGLLALGTLLHEPLPGALRAVGVGLFVLATPALRRWTKRLTQPQPVAAPLPLADVAALAAAGATLVWLVAIALSQQPRFGLLESWRVGVCATLWWSVWSAFAPDAETGPAVPGPGRDGDAAGDGSTFAAGGPQTQRVEETS